MITLNKDALDTRIQNKANEAIDEIIQNANEGVEFTEVLFPKDIYNKCRTKVNEYMEKNNVKYCWMVMNGMNSLDYGSERMMKFRLLQ